jgi:hypothetical protein
VNPLSTGDLFSHLLLARFFPLLPYSVLNVSSPTSPTRHALTLLLLT